MGYDVEVAGILAFASVCSMLVSGYRWSRRVALPPDIPAEDGCMFSLKSNVFNLTSPEDFLDGYPLDEASFWTRVRWRKIVLVILFVAALATPVASLIQVGSMRSFPKVVDSAFAAYLLFISVLSLNQTDVAQHSYYTTTQAVLSSGAASLYAVAAWIPSNVSSYSARLPWYPNLAIYLVSSVLAVTMSSGPPLHFPPEAIYSQKILQTTRNSARNNVNGVTEASFFGTLFFSYASKLLNLPPGFGVGDLPILTANMRAAVNFVKIKDCLRRRPRIVLPIGLKFRATILRVNLGPLVVVQLFSALMATARYAPAYFIRKLIAHLEKPEHGDATWGYVYVLGLFISGLVCSIGSGQLWSFSHVAGVNIISQTNTLLFMKTLVRKDVAPSSDLIKGGVTAESPQFASKSQILTLMSYDVHRVAELSRHVYTLIDSPLQLLIGTWLLYELLGVSCFVGLCATLVSLPLQHFTGKIVFRVQRELMKARDERVALTNEILNAIRMIKFMAWERKFEERLWRIREKELSRQEMTYWMKTIWITVGNIIPLLFALASFGHYTVIRNESLTPSIAFTAITVFNGLQYAISGFPEALLEGLQCLVSLRRIERYMDSEEILMVDEYSPSTPVAMDISFSSATIAWPQSQVSPPTTPDINFKLSDISVEFPAGQLSLVCGKLGSGKSLLLLALLGEADVVSGGMRCPHSPANALATFSIEGLVDPKDWVVAGICAYVPQTSWLRNESIRDNILFGLPFWPERYHKTLEVCALVADLDILEYGDLSEVGERGITLSGGQKARVSLARAVYSRASILILDDILSAVDTHTAHHLYHACLKGELMHGRTLILVSHHVQLCADGAAHIVALDNGKVQFQGGPVEFRGSAVFQSLLQTKSAPSPDIAGLVDPSLPESFKSTTSDLGVRKPEKTKQPPKLVIEESSAVGRIAWPIWSTYLRAAGGATYWLFFTIILLLGSLTPVFENGYLRAWSNAANNSKGPLHYLSVYAAILCIGLAFRMGHFLILYFGSIHTSRVLYKRLLETILFSPIRFHDTVARGSLLNRFGKDFQIIDSFIADDFGRTLKLGLSVVIIFSTITVVGGIPFLLAASLLAVIYSFLAKDFGHTSRDMRRLVSITTSPLYSIYDSSLSGVVVIRAFGASTKVLRDMMRSVDANSVAAHWQYGLNRWFTVLSVTFGGIIVTLTGLVVLVSPEMDASLAGLALLFASMVSADLMYFIRVFVGLELCLVAVERVKELSDLPHEPPEFIEPRPSTGWPSTGKIVCDGLTVRYSPDDPDVLHNLNFEILPGEKIGIVGRTGSGKSTLAMSLFRFVEATSGRILIDDIDIATLGLTDLRRNLTIIPQDPTLMSGTLRSTLDVFQQYPDAEIFEALRRVHLLSATRSNSGVFGDLDSPVSEAGDNFSAGERQLLCMARAILKRSKVLVMDEATASVDYATDELIGVTIREEFSESTILTIAHRLRSVIDYDRVMVLAEGRIVELDRPAALLKDPKSAFYGLCKATGEEEFATLQSLVRKG